MKKQLNIPKARQLPSGKWFIQLRIDGQSISITKDKEREAVAEAMAIKEGIIKAQKMPMADKILTQAIDLWIKDNENRLSPATVRGYRTCQDNGFPTLMKMKCKAITQAQIARAINAECKQYKAKTVTNRWRFISQVLTWATGETYSPRLPQIVRPDVKFLDQTELNTLLDYIKGKPVEITALLAISSLRRSEIAALNWDDGDIDLQHRWIHVRGAVVPNEDHKMVKKETTKNSTSRRDVPIIDPLFTALNAVEKKTGPVVPQHPATMLSRINKACAAAGVPEVGCHGLRHSFASLCHILNIPPQVAMEIGGWADRTTMDRIYTHVSRRDRDTYANAFTKHFQEKQNEEIANERANENQNT
jgi:integrase